MSHERIPVDDEQSAKDLISYYERNNIDYFLEEIGEITAYMWSKISKQAKEFKEDYVGQQIASTNVI